MINKPKVKSAQAEENYQKAKYNFMIGSRTLIHKTSLDLKLLQLKICLRNKQIDRAREKFFSVLGKNTGRFGLLFDGDRIVFPDELKRTVVDALHFGHPGSTKMIAGDSIFCWSGMKKDIENRCSTCTACMTFGGILKYDLLSTEKNQTTGIERRYKLIFLASYITNM